jgi:hypothetical protein
MTKILMIRHGPAAASFIEGNSLEQVSRGSKAKTTVN